MTWPGVTAEPHRFGGIEYRYGRKEMGHVHGDRLADLPFPRRIHDQVIAAGQAQPHHVLPETGWVSRWITSADEAEGGHRPLPDQLRPLRDQTRWRGRLCEKSQQTDPLPALHDGRRARRLGKYQLQGTIASGATGTAYVAYEPRPASRRHQRILCAGPAAEVPGPLPGRRAHHGGPAERELRPGLRVLRERRPGLLVEGIHRRRLASPRDDTAGAFAERRRWGPQRSPSEAFRFAHPSAFCTRLQAPEHPHRSRGSVR